MKGMMIDIILNIEYLLNIQIIGITQFLFLVLKCPPAFFGSRFLNVYTVFTWEGGKQTRVPMRVLKTIRVSTPLNKYTM